jgi:sulfoxide reductase heme-binding subunit YedZ
LAHHWLRLIVHGVALAFVGRLTWWLATDHFLIDPVREVITRTGRLGLAFLLASLSCTPLVLLTGWGRVMRMRRPLGLWSLAFALLHFLAFAAWDYRLDFSLLRIAIFDQPFVLVGAGALLILVVLGVTSLPRLRKRLGKTWPWVQRAVYLGVVLDVWHVLWLKKNPLEAWRYPAILIFLLLLRLPPVRRSLRRLRRLKTG